MRRRRSSEARPHFVGGPRCVWSGSGARARDAFDRMVGELRRTGGMPPRPELYDRVGVDLRRILNGVR